MNPFLISENPFMAMLGRRSNSINFAIGEMLRSGKPMADVLKIIEKNTVNSRIKNACKHASSQLSQGRKPEEIFRSREFMIFRPSVRYVLSCPLNDRLKGIIICCVETTKFDHPINIGSLFFLLATIFIGAFVFIAKIMFVFPQFKEIMLGLNIEPPTVLKFFFSIDGSNFSLAMLAVLLFFFGFGVIIYYLLKNLAGLKNYSEQARLLDLLASIPPDKRIETIRVLSSKTLFNKLSSNLRSFSTALDSGLSIVEACEEAKFSVLMQWFLCLGLESNESNESLKSGSLLMNSVYSGRLKMIITFIESVGTIFIGLAVGITIYAVFAGMNNLLLGIML
jgi:hypothetical protein